MKNFELIMSYSYFLSLMPSDIQQCVLNMSEWMNGLWIVMSKLTWFLKNEHDVIISDYYFNWPLI